MRMRRFASLAITGIVIAWPAVAAAQDGPSITAEPSTVEAAGEHSFVITGDGWTVPVVYLLPCAAPSVGSEVDNDTCDTSDFTPVSPTDGSFTVTVTFDIPEEGLGIGAGDTSQTESASFVDRVSSDTATELALTGPDRCLLTALLVLGAACVALGSVMLRFRLATVDTRTRPR